MSDSFYFYPGCSYETAAGYRQSVDAVCSRMDMRLQEVPDWNCCGSTACFSLQGDEGVYPPALVMARASGAGAQELVTGCNGCFNTLRKTRKLLLQDQDLHARTREKVVQEGGPDSAPHLPVRHLLQVLSSREQMQKMSRNPDMSRFRVAAYYGCLFSRPWTDVDDPEHPQMLDRFIEELGFTAVDYSLKTACCGAAHALGFKQSTEALVQRIILSMQDKDAHLAVVICPLCQLNLESAQLSLGLPRLPVLFFTQLAGLAMGIPREELGLDKLLIHPEIT